MSDSSDKTGNSKIFGVSLRGWLAFVVIYTICLMSVLGVKVEEPLYTIGGMIVAFYYGHEIGKTTPP